MQPLDALQNVFLLSWESINRMEIQAMNISYQQHLKAACSLK